MTVKVDLAEKFAQFEETYAPRIVARYEGHEVRIAKLEGPFTWHSHDHDELFLLIEGELDVEFRDRTETLHPSELLLIPANTEHRPVARRGTAKLLMIDPAESPNTGNHATATKAVAI
ncbi:cupin domain-containing protein [Qipengyuania atrilutea]|uniref:Cupin domain-containing protein n=1 Tax=Qipengyuania atrilutea TaxID=2744473 RepID=A0A850H2W7_9SPHN|nr:cupin domain-containing protein [Actirhodobacter atriluteus]NVD44930.1 cupin domain-containing protein [Actirhodobacter atriluteus]